MMSPLCLIKIEKLKNFSEKKFEVIHVNLRSDKNYLDTVHLTSELFSFKNGHYNIKFWVGGSKYDTGRVVMESFVSNGKVTFLEDSK